MVWVCQPWNVSRRRSPRSIPTGQDGRRPLQHELRVTYIYVLKCITHSCGLYSSFSLSPSYTLSFWFAHFRPSILISPNDMYTEELSCSFSPFVEFYNLPLTYSPLDFTDQNLLLISIYPDSKGTDETNCSLCTPPSCDFYRSKG